jgi:hypothetical protein
MEEITNEWPAKFLIPVDQAELSDPDLMDSPMVSHKEYDAPSSGRRKKKEEVQKLNNASEETSLDSLAGGGGDKLYKEENDGKEEKLEEREVTPPRDPLDEAETSKKRKASLKKPTSWKKSKANKLPFQTVLTVDGIDLIITIVSETLEDILQRSEDKQETMFDRIEEELKGVQQALYSSRTVSTMPPPLEGVDLGDEPAQLCILEDSTKAHLFCIQEEK